MGKPEQALDPSMEEILASIRKIIAEDNAPASPVRQAPQLAVVQEPSDESESDPAPAELQPNKPNPAPEIRTRAPEALQKPPEPDTRPEPRVRGVPLAPDRDHAARESGRPTQIDEANTTLAQLRDAASHERREDIRSDSAADSAVRQMARMSDRPERTEASRSGTFGESRDEAPSEGVVRAHATEAKARHTEPAEEQSLLSPRADEAVQSAFDQLAHSILGNQSRTLEDLVQELLRPMLRNWLDDNLPVLVERLVREEIERVSRGRR